MGSAEQAAILNRVGVPAASPPGVPVNVLAGNGGYIVTTLASTFRWSTW